MNQEELQFADEFVSTRARTKAIQGLDGDTDQAAQAVRLEKSTGNDAQMIYGNHENFVKDYKGFLTQRMLDRNPGLEDYINSHPMAAIVSKDDWNNMADFYDHLDYWMGNKWALKPIKAYLGASYGFAKGFSEKFDTRGLGQWIAPEFWKEAPYSALAYTALGAPLELAGRVIGGGIGGLEETFGRDVAQMAEWAVTDPTLATMGGPPSAAAVGFARLARALNTPIPQVVKAARELDAARKAGAPWLKAGELPPAGVHPIWDSVIADDVKHRMSIYDALVENVNKTETKAVSPDMLQKAIELKTKEDVFIHWDAVQKLYGEKIPEPGDGLLGDVPGFIEQYQNAIDTASDIQVSLATWLSKVDPEVVRGLHDDIRFRPGDPTLREVGAFPTVEQVTGDLLKRAEEPAAVAAPEPVAEPPLERLSRLRVEYADRLATHGALEHEPTPEGNLLQSLAAVTGKTFEADKVSNATRWAYFNERPDIVERALELAKLSDPQLHARLETELSNLNRYADAQKAVQTEMAQKPWGLREGDAAKFPTTRELLSSPEWKPIGDVTIARAPGELSEIEGLVRRLVGVIFENLGGPGAGAKLVAAREIRMGLERPTPVEAAYVMPTWNSLIKDPTISFILAAEDPVKNIGHEFMHHLYRYRFLKDNEWASLVSASEREGWVDRHKIRERYPEGGPELLVEESIAEEFGSWLSRRLDERVAHPNAGIFQKIADFLFRVKTVLRELFGRDPTVEEIFREIESGQVAKREPTGAPLFEGTPLERAAAPKIEVPKIEAEGLLGILPKGREQRYLNLINKQNAKDVQKLFEQAHKDEAKRQTPEWNLNYARQYEQSLAQLKDRPDFRVSAFFRNGVIGDQKMEGLPKLDPKFFTKEEREALPDKWFRQRDGFAPNDIASYFGYKTGQEMKNAMIRFEAEKGTGKPETMMERLAAKETERRMERQYGNLDENILREAREHAIGLERFDLLHEETLALADKLGQQFTLFKQDIRDQAAHKFNETISGQVSLIKYTREIGRSNRAAEDAWLKGDALGAFVERQRTLQLQALAEHAKKFEKDRATYERNRKRFSKREVEGVHPEYTNWIHHILNRTGPEVRSPADLLREINSHDAKTLQAFLDEKSGQAWLPEGYRELEVEFNPQIPVWEELIDPDGWNGYIETASVGRYRAVNESIKALIKAGRDELTGILEGKAFERNAEIDKMLEAFQKTGIDKLPPVGDLTKWQQIRLNGHRLKASLLQQEYVWGRLDQDPYGGIFYRHFTKPFASSGNEYRLLIAEYGEKLNIIKQETSKGIDLKTANIPNDVLRESKYGMPPESAPHLEDRYLGNGYLNRAQLRAVMLNISDAGKKGNLSKLSRGYHADPQAVVDWVNKHAIKEDWDYVQKIWKLFEEIQDRDDIISREMSGVAMERLPFGKVQTAFGEINGGYYPMVYDQSRGGGGKGGKIDPDLPNGIRVLTDRGWERMRTNYAGPVSLSLGQIENQLTRRLRNIAFREVLTESQRFFRDTRFQAAMTRHLGQEYTEMLIPYLRDIAGIRGLISKEQVAIENAFSYFTQNAVTTFVGLNPGTLVKHNFTAFFQSFKEIKDKRYLAMAVHDMFTGVDNVVTGNHEFVNDISAEIKGRRPNWMEALGGETDIITGEQTLRSKVTHFMSAPIAFVDQAISKWLWYAKYREVMDELMPTAAKFEHARNEAITQADLAVRRTHGSTAITSRPAAMRKPILKPFVSLYGFFNHIFNRMYEISWEGRKLAQDIKKGEATLGDVQHLASQAFYAVVPAAIIEELVTPLFDKDDRSWGTRFLMALGFPITSSVPLVREIAHGLFTQHDPSFGILQGSYKAVTDFSRLIQKGPDPDKFGDQLGATITLMGMGFGLGSQQAGRWAKFGYNYFTHRDQPQTKEEWYRAFRYGTSKERRRH